MVDRARLEIVRLFTQSGGSNPPLSVQRTLKLGDIMDFVRILIAILLPPLGVFLQVGIGKQFWINIVLTLLGYFPGIIHAIWVIAKYD